MQRVTRLPLLMDVSTELVFYFSSMRVLLVLAFFHIRFLFPSSLFTPAYLHQAQGCRYWSVDHKVLWHLIACCGWYLHSKVRYLDIQTEKLCNKGPK